MKFWSVSQQLGLVKLLRTVVSKNFVPSRWRRPINGKNTMITVAVEGNIGSGKSTFLEFFQPFPSVEVLSEPVELWTNVNKKYNALNLLYQDPARWSFLFNQYANLTRLKQHQMQTKLPVKMMERSLYSTQHIFVKNDYRSGALSELEHDVLAEWFNYLVASQSIHVDLFVYLRASPGVCLRRVQQRARPEENNISLQFLEQLHELHEEMLVKLVDKNIELPGHVLVLDADRDLQHMRQVYTEHKDDILTGCVV